jgi:septal ring factor EnvC (AmiA/AmiB activator)
MALNGWAQTQKPDRARLEQQRNELLEEINFTRQELEKVERQRKSSVNQLVTLKRQVEVRNKVIDNYEQEVSLLNREMEQTRSIVVALERDLQRLRTEYAKMLRVAQKRLNGYPDWMLILSSDHLNQAFRRIQYLRQYQAHRKTQGEMIEMARASLTRHRQDLGRVADEKKGVLVKEEEQRNLLAGESARTGEIVRRLQQDEKTLRRKLREKEEARRALQRSIEAIIRRELELAR